MSINNINAISINGSLLIAGENSGFDLAKIKPGMRLTDGSRVYEVIGIPLIRHLDIDSMSNSISLELKADNISPDDLQGKTLMAV